MTALMGWIRRKFKIVVEKKNPLEGLIEQLLNKLEKNFVRKLRETVFRALQRKCEKRIWDELLKHAEAQLTKACQRSGSLQAPEPTQRAVGMKLGGIDQAAISN